MPLRHELFPCLAVFHHLLRHRLVRHGQELFFVEPELECIVGGDVDVHHLLFGGHDLRRRVRNEVLLRPHHEPVQAERCVTGDDGHGLPLDAYGVVGRKVGDGPGFLGEKLDGACCAVVDGVHVQRGFGSELGRETVVVAIVVEGAEHEPAGHVSLGGHRLQGDLFVGGFLEDVCRGIAKGGVRAAQ